MFSRIVPVAVVVLGLSASASAQQIIQLTMEELTGKVIQAGRGGIAMTDAAGRKWSLTLGRDAKVKVTGRASPEVLGQGTYVRFVAAIDRRQGRAQEKIKRITIFNPSQGDPERMPGVQRAGGVGGAGDIQPGAGAAALPGGAAAAPIDLGPEKPPAGTRPPRTSSRRRPADKSADAPVGNVDTYDVRGQVVSCKNGRLIVYAPSPFFRGKLNAELAEDASIEVDLTDCSVARPGDSITARVVYSQAGSGDAKDVRIELKQPLSVAGKKPRKPAAKQPAEAEPGEVAVAPGPAAGKDKPAVKPPIKKPAAKGKPSDDDLPEIKDEPAGKADAKPDPGAAARSKGEEIFKFLTLKPEELQGKPTLQVSLQAGETQAFTPCKHEPAKNIREKFGAPDSVTDVNGMFPDEQGKQRQVQWQLWAYGPLKFFVDEKGNILYSSWGK